MQPLTPKLLLTLLGLLAGSAVGYAQTIGKPAVHGLTHTGIRRLPPIDSTSIPAEEAVFLETIHPPGVSEPEQPQAGEVVAEFAPQKRAKLWEGSCELGLDGAEGNSRTFNLHFGFEAKRKTDWDVLSVDLDYRKATSEGGETANQTFFDWRDQWPFDQSPWSCFVHGTLDYDAFKAFDMRVTLDVGLGYQFVKTESTSFSGRLGGGFSREIGGPDNTYVPEATFGLDFEHRLSERQKLTAAVDYTPDLTAMNDFRFNSRASWELLVDEEMNLSLKLSVTDRYDSTPNGARPNDVDYSAVLLWKF